MDWGGLLLRLLLRLLLLVVLLLLRLLLLPVMLLWRLLVGGRSLALAGSWLLLLPPMRLLLWRWGLCCPRMLVLR